MPPGRDTITSSPAHRATFGVRKGATRGTSVVEDTHQSPHSMRLQQGSTISSSISIEMLIAAMGQCSRVSVEERTLCHILCPLLVACVRDDECNHEPATRGQRREAGTIPNDRQSKVVNLTLFWPPPPPSHRRLSDHLIDHNAGCAVLV
jgi:hypothetical protein